MCGWNTPIRRWWLISNCLLPSYGWVHCCGSWMGLWVCWLNPRWNTVVQRWLQRWLLTSACLLPSCRWIRCCGCWVHCVCVCVCVYVCVCFILVVSIRLTVLGLAYDACCCLVFLFFFSLPVWSKCKFLRLSGSEFQTDGTVTMKLIERSPKDFRFRLGIFSNFSFVLCTIPFLVTELHQPF